MFKFTASRLTLAITLTVLSATAAHASDTGSIPSPTLASVTGTDPMPTSPNVVDMLVSLMYLA